MQTETVSLNVAGSGAGTASPIGNYVDKWVFWSAIAGGASVDVEVSYDASTWIKVGSSITAASGYVEVPVRALYIRTNRTVAGTGTPVFTLVAAHQ